MNIQHFLILGQTHSKTPFCAQSFPFFDAVNLFNSLWLKKKKTTETRAENDQKKRRHLDKSPKNPLKSSEIPIFRWNDIEIT